VGKFVSDDKSINTQTILVYGHYDVQPAEAKDGWSTFDPFEIQEKEWGEEKRLVARGIVDNKAQNFIHLFTVAKLKQEGKLKYDVIFVLEGNEESGNDELPKILKEYKSKFSAHTVLVSDGEIVKDFPVMEEALRGGANIRVQLKTGKNNLHSGIFGGAVPSATNELVKLLTQTKDKNNKVLVPGFYEGVVWPNKKVLENNKNLGKDKESLKISGTKKLLSLKNYDFYTQTGCLPTLEISGLKGGYIDEGFANIVPATSEARINLRFSAGQKSQKIIDAVVKFLKKNTPKYAEIMIETENHGDAIKLDTDGEVASEIKNILKEVYGKKVLSKYVGGSIPILGDFQKILGAKVLSVSLGNDDCNMHGVDENFKIDLIEKGLKFSNKFFKFD
jgi:acetylornithine deacetylase/succinyl-diaminopimelate desuccinylase-like protein